MEVGGSDGSGSKKSGLVQVSRKESGSPPGFQVLVTKIHVWLWFFRDQVRVPKRSSFSPRFQVFGHLSLHIWWWPCSSSQLLDILCCKQGQNICVNYAEIFGGIGVLFFNENSAVILIW